MAGLFAVRVRSPPPLRTEAEGIPLKLCAASLAPTPFKAYYAWVSNPVHLGAYHPSHSAFVGCPQQRTHLSSQRNARICSSGVNRVVSATELKKLSGVQP